MAVRNVRTRLVIEGEAEYKAAASRINSELKTQESALKLVDAQCRANGSSAETLTAKSEALSKVLAIQKEKQEQLEKVIESARTAEEKLQKRKAELTKELEKNQAALEKLKGSSEGTKKEQEELTDKEKRLTAELEQTEKAISKVHNRANGWETQLNHTKGAVVELEAAVKENETALRETEKGTGKLRQAFERLGVGAEEGEYGVTALAAALASQKLPEMFDKVKEALEGCIEASMDFESAMAGVKKTTDLSDAELSEMGDTFKRLSTEIPITASELAGIAESAGQLGIEKDRLVEFTTTMANLGVATNMTSEEAATLLARFANVTGMNPENYEKLGSVVVDLGNNFATTESEIVNMGQWLSSAGRLAGLTEPQIMALAASMSSVGIQAEAGGTAMTQTLTAIEKAVDKGGKKLETFASIAGMSANDFSEQWKNSPMEAIQAFISGLGSLDDEGESATKTLEDLGMTGIRQSNMLKSLSSASGLLSRAVNTANNAWEENNALAKEAATRYDTTESKFQMFKNSVDNLKIAVGDQLNPALGNLADVGTDVVSWAAEFVEQNQWLGPVISGVVSTLGVLTTGLTGFAIVTKAVIPLIQAFNTSMSMSTFGLVALAIGGVVTTVTALAKAIGDTSPELERLTDSAKNLKDTVNDANSAYEENVGRTEAAADVANKYIDRLEELEKAGLKTNEQQNEYRRILRLLCESVPELSKHIDLENGKLLVSTDALRENTEEWRKNAIEQAKRERLDAVYKDVVETQLDLSEAEKKLEPVLSKRRDTEVRLRDAIKRREQVESDIAEESKKVEKGDEKAAERLQNLQEKYQELGNEIAGHREILGDTQQEYDTYTKAVEENEKALSDAEGQIGDIEKAFDDAFGATENNTGAVEDNTEALQDNAEAQELNEKATKSVRDMMEDLAKEYRNAYDEAYNSISGQAGLFGDFTAELNEDVDTVEEMMGRWSDQVQNVDRYTRNLKLAAQYGIDDGLIASLSDGSAESAGYLQVIIDKYQDLGATADTTKDDIEKSTGPLKDFSDQFNGAFRDTQEAKDAFSTTVVSMRDDLKDLTEEIAQMAKDIGFEDITEAFQEAFTLKGVDYKAIGLNFTEGLAEGISGNTERVEYSAEEVADLTLEKLKEKLGIHSPSTVTREVGENFDAGLVEGIKAKSEDVQNAAENTADGVERTLKTSAEKSVKGFTDEFGKLPPKTKTKMELLRQTIKNAAAPIPGDMKTVGEQIVDGMIAGMNNRSSSLYETISGVVNSAIERAKKAAATASPSKKTTAIFENVGDGMILGLEHRRERIKETAQSVVDEALQLNINGKVEAAISGIDDRLPVVRYPEKAASESAPTYQIGDINVEIRTETGEPEEIYQTLTRRLKREVERETRVKRA